MLFGPEFRWVIEGYTPETIPMTRLAEYVRELGKLLGHETSVHFVRLEKSSTAIVSKTDLPVNAGKIEARVNAVRRGTGQLDASRAYENLNQMLANDGTSARLYRGKAVVINFPGKARAIQTLIEIEDYGSATGYLYMLYEGRNEFRARLRIDNDTSLQCGCVADAIPQLKENLFGVVRVHGIGRWARTTSGIWHPFHIKIDRVQKVSAVPFREVIDSLRSLDIQWPDDPLGDLVELNETDGVVQ